MGSRKGKEPRTSPKWAACEGGDTSKAEDGTGTTDELKRRAVKQRLDKGLGNTDTPKPDHEPDPRAERDAELHRREYRAEKVEA